MFLKRKSYENRKLCKVVISKHEKFREKFQLSEITDNHKKVMEVISMINKSNAKVVDFGGGGGTLYFVAEKFFPEASFDWNVVETKQMVKQARKFIKNGPNFHSDILKLLKKNDFDLLIVSSSLQYLPNPLGFLDEIMDKKIDYIFFTRTPLTNLSRSYSFLQESYLSENGPGELPRGIKDKKVFYPCNIPAKIDFLNTLQGKFNILEIYTENQFQTKFESVEMYGILAKKVTSVG
jgi:putative methyltransferase (TIGR04325 family)